MVLHRAWPSTKGVIAGPWRCSSYLSAWPDRLEIRRSAAAKMKISDEIVGPVKGAWHLFLERTESLRPDLHKYCRSLSGSVWDGEDLLQDTLLRAFARLSQASEPIENLRAYMFKIASNLWIDKFRAAYENSPLRIFRNLAPAGMQRGHTRFVMPPGSLLTHLPPMERSDRSRLQRCSSISAWKQPGSCV